MSLLTDLVASYALDEASGDALDAHASKTLTETSGLIGAATGKVSGARDYERGDTEYHFRADSAFSLTGDFTVSVWLKPESVASGDGTYGAGGCSHMTGDQAGDWWISVNSAGDIVCVHFDIAGENVAGRMTTDTAYATNGAWTHVVFRLFGSTYTIWVDGVSRAFTAETTDSAWSDLGGFSIGWQYDGGGAYRWDGLVDQLDVWSRALTDGEIGEVNNAGAGLAYADFGEGGGEESAIAVIVVHLNRLRRAG